MMRVKGYGRLVLAAAIALSVLFGFQRETSAAPAADQPDIVVCPSCEVTSIQDAIDNAPVGGTVEVRAGTYAGPITITSKVSLIGVDRPVIDGGGKGTVVHGIGAEFTISGFNVRGSGQTLDHEDTGILVDKGRAVIIDNVVEDSLFGIYLKDAPGSVIRNNTVISKPLPIALRGDGIRVWYCDDMVIEGNQADAGRDVILWYSNRGLVRDNEFNNGRYGLHLMFSDDAVIESNSLSENSIGLYIMYSRNASVVGNTLSNNSGPSGGGLGLKDVDLAVVKGNRFVNNRIAAQVDTSPREPGIENLWIGNVFAYNEVALGIMPAVRNNTLSENSFIDNIQNVTILGGGQLRDITWSVDGRGNYWSDYAGYDADGNGVGDVPYRSEELFESLMDDHPQLRLFLFSPAATAIDFAAKAFPEVRPRTRFIDDAPLMSPPVDAVLPAAAQASDISRALSGLFGLVAVAGALALIVVERRGAGRSERVPNVPAGEGQMEEVVATVARDPSEQGRDADPTRAVSVVDITKRFGRVAAVDSVSFDVDRSEAVALWGPNGAGKTTILRCLLGVARYSGAISIDGLDPARDGRTARRRIGYVPQDLAPSAMTVEEMVSFVATLKKATRADGIAQIRRLGIEDARDKPISALSGGMKQRLALSLALIGTPSILLLDEPTANLDARGRAELLDLLRDLKRDGMTLIFSSHRPDDILSLADRVLMIEGGRLDRILSPETFANDVGRATRLTVTLTNGHAREAIETLAELGLAPDRVGKNISVEIHSRDKASVLAALTRSGVEIEDFELEHGTWTGQ
jgi:nitrous oxidase accessory protein